MELRRVIGTVLRMALVLCQLLALHGCLIETFYGVLINGSMHDEHMALHVVQHTGPMRAYRTPIGLLLGVSPEVSLQALPLTAPRKHLPAEGAYERICRFNSQTRG